AQQIDRHGGKLQRRAALQEQHLVVGRNAHQLAQIGFGGGDHPLEIGRAMAHFHDAHAAPVPVEHFLGGLAQYRLRQGRRAGTEVENACHSAAPSLPTSPASPFPSSPSPFSASFSGSDSATFSRPASREPSSRLIRVTPCVARLISRICSTLVRISTPASEISMTSSSAFTSAAPTTLPLRSEVWIAIMPLVPRPWRVYSAIGVRLP